MDRIRNEAIRAKVTTAEAAAAGQLQVGSGHGPVHHFHALWPKPQD